MTDTQQQLPDPSDPDFQLVLKSLIEVYRPILEEDLKRAGDLQALGEEARKAAPDCEAELAAAQRLLGQFPDEKVVLALLPARARELLGPIERWRWCFLHIRCCMIFGWLVCRRPRTFRLSAYYLYRYWLCVRQAVGSPVTPGRLSDSERRDLNTLVEALAKAYRPFLTDQLASIDFTAGLSDDVAAGKVDCSEGDEDAAEVFERLLTVDTAQALLGEEAFRHHSQEPFFWFCRCWCLCAIRFGCCLARARSLVDVYRCLQLYWQCLRECFRPLTCELIVAQECIAEELNTVIPAFVVPIHGTAGGLGFVNYELEWSTDTKTWSTMDFVYPPIGSGNPKGTIPVFGGILAYFKTTYHDAGTYFFRLTVNGANAKVTCGPIVFSIFKKDVRILGVANNFSLDSPWPDPAARLTDLVPKKCLRPPGTFEASFGTCLYVWGSAFVGGCPSREIHRYALDYKRGYETDCTDPTGWTNFTSIVFTTPAQRRAINMRTDTSVLTAVWGPTCLVPTSNAPWCLLFEPDGQLMPTTWNTNIGGCQLSGLFTLRLVVEDTLGNSYCDTQRLWLDNKPITALITILSVPKCTDLFISKFATPPDCSVEWNLPLSGIAYDEYIDETLPLTRPNDNFDYYAITLEKQGGQTIDIPITGAALNCFFGTSRVGDPGTRCGVPTVPRVIATLTDFDLRTLDRNCHPPGIPVDFTLERGTCCVYIFHLAVFDRTSRPCGTNVATSHWPVKICNDLPP